MTTSSTTESATSSLTCGRHQEAQQAPLQRAAAALRFLEELRLAGSMRASPVVAHRGRHQLTHHLCSTLWAGDRQVSRQTMCGSCHMACTTCRNSLAFFPTAQCVAHHDVTALWLCAFLLTLPGPVTGGFKYSSAQHENSQPHCTHVKKLQNYCCCCLWLQFNKPAGAAAWSLSVARKVWQHTAVQLRLSTAASTCIANTATPFRGKPYL